MTTINFPELKETEGKLDAARGKLKSIFDEAGPTFDMSLVKGIPGGTVAVVEEIKRINNELDELGTKHGDLMAVLKGAQVLAEGESWARHAEQGADGGARRTKSFGERFAESEARTRKGVEVDLGLTLPQVKTLFQRSAGWNPESVREPGYVPAASAPIMVLDLIPTLPTKQAAVKYMEQTTRTNNAAERAEGGTYGEAAFVLTERSVTVETVGVWLPATDEQLEDEEEAAAMIDLELPLMLRQRMDLQVLVGDGSTPNILGGNNKPSIQTQAKGTDPVFDAVHKLLTKLRVTGRSNPDLLVWHPNDWQDVRLTRTADGIYILGNPTEAGPSQMWGVRCSQSDNQTENTIFGGDFGGYARLYVRRDVVVERTNSHDTHFINGKQAIRAGVRVAMVWKRAAAFGTVTGV